MNIIHKESNEVFQVLKKENIFFKGKKILLLGSDGFLGRYFVEYFKCLLKNNIQLNLDCVDNNISSEHISSPSNKNIKFYKNNVMKFNNKKKYDVIIFLAGIASPTIYKKYPIESLEVSYLGAKKFLEKSKKDKSQFIFFSSSEIYGNPDNKNVPTKETYYGNVNSFGPRSCYDEGKRVGETLCYIYKNYLNTNIKIIRPFNVFGPGMSVNDDRVIPRFIRAQKKKKPLTIYNHGKQTRSFCYITDAMIGFIKVISLGKKGEIYNVGNDTEEVTMNKLANLVKTISQDKKLKIKNVDYPNHYPSNEPMRRCPDLKKINKDTKFKPLFSLRASLKSFIDNY
jgi:UDP-glucuronate decarboxylase